MKHSLNIAVYFSRRTCNVQFFRPNDCGSGENTNMNIPVRCNHIFIGINFFFLRNFLQPKHCLPHSWYYLWNVKILQSLSGECLFKCSDILPEQTRDVNYLWKPGIQKKSHQCWTEIGLLCSRKSLTYNICYLQEIAINNAFQPHISVFIERSSE